MLRFYHTYDPHIFKWVGVVQRKIIKPLFSKGFFTSSDLKLLIQFCYPLDEPLAGPLSYVFRYKPSDGEFYNVFCLLDQTSYQFTDLDVNQQCCICIITSYYHFDIYEDLLKIIRSLLLNSITSVENFLSTLYSSPQNIGAVSSLNKYRSSLPSNDSILTNITKDALSIMSVQALGRVVVGMLTDTPIIVVSSDLSKLSRFCYAILALIYPLEWHLLFAPILPLSLLESVQSPAPFIVGLPRKLIPKVSNCDIEGHILLDIDDQIMNVNGLSNLPKWVINKINSLNNGSLIEFRQFMMSMLCTALGIQTANTPQTTIKRINVARKNIKFEPNTFSFNLVSSRTLQNLFDILQERSLPADFSRLISLGNTSRVTSLAVQDLEEFPLKSSAMAKSKSLCFREGNDSVNKSPSLPALPSKPVNDSTSDDSSQQQVQIEVVLNS